MRKQGKQSATPQPAPQETQKAAQPQRLRLEQLKRRIQRFQHDHRRG